MGNVDEPPCHVFFGTSPAIKLERDKAKYNWFIVELNLFSYNVYYKFIKSIV
jgi:hypothetical protein